MEKAFPALRTGTLYFYFFPPCSYHLTSQLPSNRVTSPPKAAPHERGVQPVSLATALLVGAQLFERKIQWE